MEGEIAEAEKRILHIKKELIPDDWYVLFVLTGEEDRVRKRLEYSFGQEQLRPLVPQRRLKERKRGRVYECVRTVFPGYVFVHTPIIDDVYYDMKYIPGVIKVLKDDKRPVAVEPHEMEPILALTRASEIIDFSTGALIGGCVIILDGPLKGCEGIIVSVDKRKGRAKVKINMMGQERLVDLGLNIIGLM